MPIYPFDSNGKVHTRANKNLSPQDYRIQWFQDRIKEGEAREEALKNAKDALQTKLMAEIERLKAENDKMFKQLDKAWNKEQLARG